MPTIDLIRVKKVFCTPKLSQDKDYGDRAFKFHQKCDRTPRNQFFLCGRSLNLGVIYRNFCKKYVSGVINILNLAKNYKLGKITMRHAIGTIPVVLVGLFSASAAQPWTGATVSVNGGAVVSRNKNSPDGWQLRFLLIQAF